MELCDWLRLFLARAQHPPIFGRTQGNFQFSAIRDFNTDDRNQEPRSSATTVKMATELTVQSERAFQKQPHIFLNSKTKLKTARPGKNGRRWVGWPWQHHELAGLG